MPAAGPADRPPRTDPRQRRPRPRPGRADSRRHRRGVAAYRGPPAADGTAQPLGLRGGLWRPARFRQRLPFDTEREDYLVHITTGTHVAQICWFLLTEARYLPARLVQTSPSRRKDEARHPEGSATLIDLDLSATTASPRGSAANRRKAWLSQVGNRHAQCRFQPLHRADRAGRRAFAGTHAAGGADRCRQIVPRPAHL